MRKKVDYFIGYAANAVRRFERDGNWEASRDMRIMGQLLEQVRDHLKAPKRSYWKKGFKQKSK